MRTSENRTTEISKSQGPSVLKTHNLSLWVSQFDINISPLSRLPAGFALLPRKPASPWEAIGPDFGRYQRNHQRCAGKSYFILKVHTLFQFLPWNMKVDKFWNWLINDILKNMQVNQNHIRMLFEKSSHFFSFWLETWKLTYALHLSQKQLKDVQINCLEHL